jgi:RPA family protein
MASMREVAWRVFSGEYNASDLEHSTGEERSASYVVTPLGAKVNRLFLVGVLTDLENVGTDTEPLWRARISDPTGVFYVSAGQYQPEAAKALSRMKAPSFVAIIVPAGPAAQP